MKYFAKVDGVEYEILFWGPVEGCPARAEARRLGHPPEDVRDWKLLERILERASWARRVEAPGTEAWRTLWTDRILEAMREIATLREQLAKTEERLGDDRRIEQLEKETAHIHSMRDRLAIVETEWPGVGRVKQYGEVVTAIQRELSQVLNRVQRVEDELVDKTLISLDGRAASINSLHEQTVREVAKLRADHAGELESLRIRIGGLEAIVGRLVNHGGGAEGRAEPAK